MQTLQFLQDRYCRSSNIHSLTWTIEKLQTCGTPQTVPAKKQNNLSLVLLPSLLHFGDYLRQAYVGMSQVEKNIRFIMECAVSHCVCKSLRNSSIMISLINEVSLKIQKNYTKNISLPSLEGPSQLTCTLKIPWCCLQENTFKVKKVNCLACICILNMHTRQFITSRVLQHQQDALMKTTCCLLFDTGYILTVMK